MQYPIEITGAPNVFPLYNVMCFYYQILFVQCSYNRFSYTTGSWAFIHPAALLFCVLWAYSLSILQPVENIFKIYSLLSQRKITSTHLKLSLKTLSSTAFLDTVGPICRCQSSPACCCQARCHMYLVTMAVFATSNLKLILWLLQIVVWGAEQTQ